MVRKVYLYGDKINKSILGQIKDSVGYNGISSDNKQIAFVNLHEIRDINLRPKMSKKNPAALYLCRVAGFVNYSNSIRLLWLVLHIVIIFAVSYHHVALLYLLYSFSDIFEVNMRSINSTYTY